MKSYFGCLSVGPVLVALVTGGAAAEEKSLQELEKANTDKIAALTALDHSTILYTLAGQFVGIARDGQLGWIDTGHNPARNACASPHAALSHDGSHVAFVSDGDGRDRCRIVVLNIVSGERRNLVEAMWSPQQISWSWDDKEISYFANGIALVSASGENVTGGDITVIPLPKIDEKGRGIDFGGSTPFQWSHNGNSFVVSLLAHVPAKEPQSFTNESELFSVYEGESRMLDTGYRPCVSPLSDEVGYYTREGIASINADGTGKRLLWKVPAVSHFSVNKVLFGSNTLDKPIVWSKDGSQIFFGTWESENYSDNIYLLEVKSGKSKLFLSKTSITIEGWR